MDFEHRFDLEAVGAEVLGGSLGGNQLESLLLQFAGHFHQSFLVTVVGGEKHGALGGKHFACSQLGFGVGHSKVAGGAHDFAS